MQAQWSRPDGTPWSMWILSAGHFENEPGYVTFGIMFDSIGSFHRNGTAVFNESIENYYPPATPNREAAIHRHKFRTLIHEVGHAFNFAHSWQKELGNTWHSSVSNEPNAMSFMNYPRKVTGGADAYWEGFRFAFSDQELLFLRHAPDHFVSMGGSSWFVNHADASREIDLGEVLSRTSDAVAATSGPFELELRFHRPKPVFGFLEPVRMELKLTNASGEQIEVPRDVVEDPATMDIYVTRNQGETRRLLPYVKTCHETDTIVLKPGESVYGSAYISSATNGWLIAEPGRYDIVASLRSACECDGGDRCILADATTTIYVRNPSPQKRREEDRLAQDVFGDDVGRILAMGGSKFLESGNDVLRELGERFPTCAAAAHAGVALALPDTREYKLVETERDGRLKLSPKKPNLEQARTMLERVLIDDGSHAATSLGHIDFKRVTDRVAHRLECADEKGMAAKFQENILEVMKRRGVSLPDRVSMGIQKRIADLKD